MKDKYTKTVHNTGYIGEGDNLCKGKIYEDWHSMMRRCYSEKEKLRQPSYINCIVGVRQSNLKFRAQINKFGISKSLGTYNSCEEAFNVYKFEKEKYIKELAEIWKEKISEKIYNILINYIVEITD